MMNVRRKDLPAVIALLPALQRPTVSPLSPIELPGESAPAAEEWVAVNTVLEERAVRTLIPALTAAQAQGIVEYPLNKVVL